MWHSSALVWTRLNQNMSKTEFKVGDKVWVETSTDNYIAGTIMKSEGGNKYEVEEDADEDNPIHKGITADKISLQTEEDFKED